MLRTEVKILVIDDVSTMRVQINKLLMKFGFLMISVAESVMDAQKLMEEETYDLILCDWHMLPIDGLEFLKYIRANPDTAKTPFIMVTAESNREKVQEAIRSGVDEFILKPITLTQIEEKVHKVLVRKKVL